MIWDWFMYHHNFKNSEILQMDLFNVKLVAHMFIIIKQITSPSDHLWEEIKLIPSEGNHLLIENRVEVLIQ